MTTTVTLGKAELLSWAKSSTGISPCNKYDDLKDGLIMLALMELLFPGFVPAGEVRSQRVGKRNPSFNWDILTASCSQIGLPKHICDRKGIVAGHQRPCYNMLVMFYFLSKLAGSAEFSVDFTNPIDDELAAFLQSPQSAACLQKGRTKAYPQLTGQRSGQQQQADRQLLDESAFNFSQAESSRQSPPRSRYDGAGSAAHRSSPTHSPNIAASQPARQGPPAPHNLNLGGRADSATGAAAPHISASAIPYDYNTALSAVVSTWGSANSSSVGEVTIARLRRDLRHAIDAKGHAVKELSYVRSIGRNALDAQRVLAEAELERLKGVMHSQLATHREELAHYYEGAAAEAHAEVQRALDEAAVEREHLQFDLTAQSLGATNTVSNELRFDQLYAELLELRQQKQLFLAKIRMQEQQLQRSKETEGALANTIREQQAGYDRVQASLAATTKRLANTRAILPNTGETIFESLSPAEQFPIVARIRQLESELEAAAAARTSLEAELENLRQHLEEDNRRAQTSQVATELHFECARLQKDNERLGRVNHYLIEASGKIKGLSAIADGDYHSVRLDADLTVPSSMIDNATLTNISSEALAAVDAAAKALTSGQAASTTVIDGLGKGYWALATAAAILQSRVEIAAASIKALYNRNVSAQKDLLTQKHNAQGELKALEAQLVRDRDDAVVMANRHQQELNLRLEITKEDLAQARASMSGSTRQLQMAGQAILADCDRLMRDPKQRIEVLQRSETALKTREATWQELTEALRLTLRYSMNNNGRIQSADEERINELAMRIAKGPEGSGSAMDYSAHEDTLNAAIRDALGHLQQRWEGCIKEIIHMGKQGASYSERAAAQGVELVAARTDLQRAADMLKTLDRKCEGLKAERAEAADGQSDALAKLRALEDAHRDHIAESQAQYEKTIALLQASPIFGGEVGHVNTMAAASQVVSGKVVERSNSSTAQAPSPLPQVASTHPTKLRASTITGHSSSSFAAFRAGRGTTMNTMNSSLSGAEQQQSGAAESSLRPIGGVTTTFSVASSMNDHAPQGSRVPLTQPDTSQPLRLDNSPPTRSSLKSFSSSGGSGKVAAINAPSDPPSASSLHLMPSAIPMAALAKPMYADDYTTDVLPSPPPAAPATSARKGLVLSAEEMERRKNEILAKYGVK